MAQYDKLISIDTLGDFKNECDNAYLSEVPKATASSLGAVRPDGTTITVDANGVISSSGGGSADVGNAKIFYGTCSTSAGTAAKAVACSEFTSADIVAGTIIFVKFTNGQTYNGTPSLDINSTGAHAAKRYGTTNAPRYWWVAGEVVGFVYDGTYWLTIRGGLATTTYFGLTKLENSVESTSTTYAATPNSVKMAYDHADDLLSPISGAVTLVYTGGGGSLETGTGVIQSGNVVTVSLIYSSTSSMAWNNEVMASIDPSFAPALGCRFPVFATSDWDTSLIGYATINSSGEIVVYSKNTKVIFGTFTYVVNTGSSAVQAANGVSF